MLCAHSDGRICSQLSEAVSGSLNAIWIVVLEAVGAIDHSLDIGSDIIDPSNHIISNFANEFGGSIDCILLP